MSFTSSRYFVGQRLKLNPHYEIWKTSEEPIDFNTILQVNEMDEDMLIAQSIKGRWEGERCFFTTPDQSLLPLANENASLIGLLKKVNG